MTRKQVFKGIITVILCFVIYIIILGLLIIVQEEFIGWKLSTFDLDGDGMFSGIEENTKEKEYWFNLLISGPGNYFVIFIPLLSGLLTVISEIIMLVVKRIKKNVFKIVIFCFLIYCIILNLLLFIREVGGFYNSVFFSSVTKEWEYWLHISLVFSPLILLFSEILTLITVIIILVIEIVKIKRVTHDNGNENAKRPCVQRNDGHPDSE